MKKIDLQNPGFNSDLKTVIERRPEFVGALRKLVACTVQYQ